MVAFDDDAVEVAAEGGVGDFVVVNADFAVEGVFGGRDEAGLAKKFFVVFGFFARGRAVGENGANAEAEFDALFEVLVKVLTQWAGDGGGAGVGELFFGGEGVFVDFLDAVEAFEVADFWQGVGGESEALEFGEEFLELAFFEVDFLELAFENGAEEFGGFGAEGEDGVFLD